MSKWSRQTVRLAGARPIRRVSASVAASDRAESETSGVLRPSGKTTDHTSARSVVDNQKRSQKTATPDDVKILMTNDLRLSVRDVIELYSLRWQIELFFKELKLTLGLPTSTSSRNLSRGG